MKTTYNYSERKHIISEMSKSSPDLSPSKIIEIVNNLRFDYAELTFDVVKEEQKGLSILVTDNKTGKKINVNSLSVYPMRYYFSLMDNYLFGNQKTEVIQENPK